MKNIQKIIAGAVAVLVGFSASVQATPITGGISFAGGYSLPGGTTFLTTPNQILFTTKSVVTGDSGSYAAAGITVGNLVTMASPLAINPTITPVNPLWSVGAFTFDAISLVESGQTANTLTLVGSGFILDGNPSDTVNGIWVATFNTLSGTFSFSASAGSVPDGGTTVMLLGAGLSGLALLRKKLAA